MHVKDYACEVNYEEWSVNLINVTEVHSLTINIASVVLSSNEI